MKKVTIVVFGKSYAALADAAGHAAACLRGGIPSENITFDNRSHVDYTVKESSDSEFCYETNEEPEIE